MYSKAFIRSLFNAWNYKHYFLKTSEFVGIMTYILSMV